MNVYNTKEVQLIKSSLTAGLNTNKSFSGNGVIRKVSIKKIMTVPYMISDKLCQFFFFENLQRIILS